MSDKGPMAAPKVFVSETSTGCRSPQPRVRSASHGECAIRLKVMNCCIASLALSLALPGFGADSANVEQRASFALAVEEAQQAISKLLTEADRDHEALAAQWRALGDAHWALGNDDAALDAFAEGSQVMRLRYGLKSVRQIHFLQRSAEVETARHKLVEANGLLEQAHELVVRAYDESDSRVTESTSSLADWYLEHHHLRAARAMYSQLLLNNADAKSNPVLRSELLRKFAKTIVSEEFPAAGPTAFIAQPACCPLSRTSSLGPRVTEATRDEAVINSLRTAQRLATTKETGDDSNRVQAIKDLGDWFFLTGRTAEAAREYSQLEASAVAAAGLRDPVALHVPHPGDPQPRWIPRGRSHQGIVEISGVVGPKGQVSGDLQVVRSVPANLDPLKYRRAVRRGIYRPGFEDGQFKVRNPITVVFEFVYLVE